MLPAQCEQGLNELAHRPALEHGRASSISGSFLVARESCHPCGHEHDRRKDDAAAAVPRGTRDRSSRRRCRPSAARRLALPAKGRRSCRAAGGAIAVARSRPPRSPIMERMRDARRPMRRFQGLEVAVTAVDGRPRGRSPGDLRPARIGRLGDRPRVGVVIRPFVRAGSRPATGSGSSPRRCATTGASSAPT